MRSWGPWMRVSNKSVRVDSDHAHRLKWVSKTLPHGCLLAFLISPSSLYLWLGAVLTLTRWPFVMVPG